MQSEEVSKERCCLRYCLVEQRTVCIVNVWGYTEILPCIALHYIIFRMARFPLFFEADHIE